MTEIDDTTNEVLTVIDAEGGAATTSDVLEETSIDQHGSVHYRFEKLRDAGMIEDVDNDEQTVKVRLTDDGQEYVDSEGDEGVQTFLEMADDVGADLSYSDGTFDEAHFYRSESLYRWLIDPETDEKDMYDEEGEMSHFLPVSICINDLIEIPEKHRYEYDCIYVLEESDEEVSLNMSDRLLLKLDEEIIDDLLNELRQACRMKRDMLIHSYADDLSHSELASKFDLSQSRVTQIVSEMREKASRKYFAMSTSDGEYVEEMDG